MTEANEYGKALFLITEEDGQSDKILADVRTAESILSGNPEYVKLLSSPAVPKSERIELVDKAFSCLDVSLCNLIKILVEKHAIHLFDKVAKAYYGLYDESRGILRVEAITAVALTEGQSAAMTEKLSKSLGKTVVLKNTVDRSILGGVKLRYSGVQLDGSVRTRLDKFEEALKNTVI